MVFILCDKAVNLDSLKYIKRACQSVLMQCISHCIFALSPVKLAIFAKTLTNCDESFLGFFFAFC